MRHGSLGASWQQTFRKVLIPNLRTAILTTSFLAFAVVMGEFAISSLLLKRTLPTYMVEAQGREPQGAMGCRLVVARSDHCSVYGSWPNSEKVSDIIFTRNQNHTMSQLEFAHVTKKYGDLRGVVCVHIVCTKRQGQLPLWVRSGCGKTTALRIDRQGSSNPDAGAIDCERPKC